MSDTQTKRAGAVCIGNVCRAICATAAVILSGANSLAYAAGGHGADHVPGIYDLRWYFVNFAIYVIGMYLLLRKPARTAWDHRRTAIIRDVEGAKQELRNAEQAHAVAQSRVAGLSAEIAALKQEIAAEGVRESARIIQESEARAERIRVHAQDSIAHEQKSLELSLRRELAELVTEKARTQLKRQITASSDKALRSATMGGVKDLLH